jgi:chlorite dismutase
MPEETSRTFNHFALHAFSDAYWTLMPEARAELRRDWLAGLRAAAPAVHLFQPTQSGLSVVSWCALPVDGPEAPARFFDCWAKANNARQPYLRTVDSLWGFTRPSQYTKTRSAQEIDPFSKTRRRYLVIYPFVKTTEWYLMGRESRQGMMNEHIRIGKQYEDISQLLLYSFGLQDQEFVVVYELDDLPRFSDLVNELRSTDGREYTLRDTPVHTAIFHPAEETLALWD